MNLLDCGASGVSVASSVAVSEYGVLVPGAKNGSGSRLVHILVRPFKGFPAGKVCPSCPASGLVTERLAPKVMTMKKAASLQVVDEYAAFVDVGSESLHVSVAGGPPEVFGTMTVELHRLRDWLKERKVHSVAMEATGVYWLPLYSVLETAGMQTCMVNGKHTRNLPGRKTDMQDCQWGATLHAHGLLRAGFVPPAQVRRLQDYVRLRGDHIANAAGCIQLQQKALERMNVKLHDVISSLAGVSGQKVIGAILAGERDPERLLLLCDKSIQKKKAERVKESLRGTWQQEHLFALRQAVETWKHYQGQIAACDREIQQVLQDLSGPESPGSPEPGPALRQPGINAPDIPKLHELLVRWCGGKDLTALPAHTDYSWLQLLSEVGTDLSKWPTEKHFCAWAGLSPGSRQSGKYRGNIGRKRNRTGRIFCIMARSLAQSKDMALGGFFRRMRARKGGLVAVGSLARKLAAWFWRLMVKGVTYVEEGLAKYEQRVLETRQRALHRMAKNLGYTVLPKFSA